MNDDALRSAENMMKAFQEAGWKEGYRFRVRCSGCEYKQELGTATAAFHFDGVVDKPGHVHSAEMRLVLLSPWEPLPPEKPEAAA